LVGTPCSSTGAGFACGGVSVLLVGSRSVACLLWPPMAWSRRRVPPGRGQLRDRVLGRACAPVVLSRRDSTSSPNDPTQERRPAPCGSARARWSVFAAADPEEDAKAHCRARAPHAETLSQQRPRLPMLPICRVSRQNHTSLRALDWHFLLRWTTDRPSLSRHAVGSCGTSVRA